MPDEIIAKPYFFDLTPDTLAEVVAAMKLKPFRAKQIMQWVYQHGVIDPQQMTNLAQRDRDILASNIRMTASDVRQHQRASDGTQKLLVQWHALANSPTKQNEGSPDTLRAENMPLQQLDNDDPKRQTECVMIPALGDSTRRTACISSQVGCPVGCRFCASGLGGLDGNLGAGQIVEQVWRLSQLPNVERISNVVFMGMGEPLSNFKAVTAAVSTLMADWGMGISGRRITISTVGLPAQIKRLAELRLPVTLAISLHAPNDTIRRRIIPWAEFVTIEQLVDAGRVYFRETGREVTLEYILLGGLNDQAEHAKELAQVARSIRSNVNLIRYNEVDPLPYKRPIDADVYRFQKILTDAGVNTHIRASRGRDIAAACGQLRHESQP